MIIKLLFTIHIQHSLVCFVLPAVLNLSVLLEYTSVVNHWSRECYSGCPGTAVFPCGLSQGWRWLMLMAQLLPLSDLTARLQEVAAHESRHVTVSRPEEVHCYSPLMPKWDSSVLQGLWHTHLTLSLSQCQITALPFLRHFILIISCSSSVMNHCFFLVRDTAS